MKNAGDPPPMDWKDIPENARVMSLPKSFFCYVYCVRHRVTWAVSDAAKANEWLEVRAKADRDKALGRLSAA